MRLLSLCSGYGGLDLAVEAFFGAETVAFAEFDKPAASVFSRHWPDVPNLHDVNAIKWDELGSIDVLTAGYPCQPFSHAGKRQGEDDARHLWPAIREGVAALRPTYVIFENVRGHLSLGFDTVIRDLEWLNYDVRWTLIRAADVGAPHGRSRVFILGVDRERSIRSGPDRRGGVHQHLDLEQAEGTDLRRARGDRDGGQGQGAPAGDASPLRRDGHEDPCGVGAVGRGASMGDLRHGGGAVPAEGRPSSALEEGAGVPGLGVAGDGGHLTAPSSAPVVGGDAGAGQAARRTDARTECHRPSADAACGTGCGSDMAEWPVGDAADDDPAGGLRVHRAVACPRRDDRGGSEGAADVGAPHGRARVFIVATLRHAERASADARAEGRRSRHPVGEPSRGAPADAALVGRPQGWPEPDRRRAAACREGAPADACGERHGRGQDPRGVGRLDGEDAGEARQRERARQVAGDRGAATPADADGPGLLRGAEQHASTATGVDGAHRRHTDGRSDGAGWGPYTGAIHRWERILGRPAPTPTDERGRLSPLLVEWLMGLPAGWVTDTPGLSRAQQLKILGNGVVPQQAFHALSLLLGSAEEVAA